MKKVLLCIALITLSLTGHVSGHPQTEPITTFETGKSPTLIIHVAVTGNDNTGDGSSGAPYATIERAAQDAVPGAAIRVHAGTYTEQSSVEGLAGTAAAPIWIGGAPGEARPVIANDSQALHLIQVRYLIIHDLEVRDTSQNGINCDDGGDYADNTATQHVVFRDLYIHDVGSGGNEDCLKLSGVNDYFVLDSEFARCGGGSSGSGIDHVGCHGGLIANNYFHELSANAVQNKGGSEAIEIRGNLMVDAGARAVNMGGSTSFEYFRPPLSTTQPNVEARDIRVISNIIRGSDAALAFVGCVDCLAANNTIVNPGNWLIRILQETTTDGDYEFLPCSNNQFTNNLVYFDRGELSTYVNIGPNTSPETFAFSNNLWYAHDNPAQSQPNLPVTESDGIAGEDPLLADPAANDYHLQTGSPAIGNGTAVAGVAYDYDGVAYNTPPSIGAFEGNTVVQPDLAPSTKTVFPAQARFGDTVTYTLNVRNATGPLDVQAWLSDTLPTGLDYVPGSFTATSGTANDGDAPDLYWTGVLSPSPVVTLTYRAIVTYTQPGTETIAAATLRNVAAISAEGATLVRVSATLPVNSQSLYLPLVLRGYAAAPRRAAAQAIQAPVLKWQRGGCYNSWCETGWYSSPAVADLDGDKAPEVIGGGYKLFILNGEDGSVQQSTDTPGSRIWPGIVVADLDNNGDLEIVTAQGDAYLNVLDHNGTVVWSQRPGSNELRALAVADLDNDKTLEIAVGTARGADINAWVYEHNGTLRAGWPQPTSEAAGWSWGVFNNNIALGDIDGDSQGEVIVPSDVHYICAYEANGSPILANAMYKESNGATRVWGRVGIWEDPTVELRGWGRCDGVRAESYRTNFADGPAVIADMDGNGTMEVIATGNVNDCHTGYPPSKYVGVYIFNADRSRFKSGGYDWSTVPVDTGAPLSEDYDVIESAQYNPAIADLDGDGKQEILFASYDGRVHAYWLDKTEHGAWPYSVYTGNGYRFAGEPTVADLDNDGHAEVIIATWTQKGRHQTGDLIILDYLGNVLHKVALPAAFSGDWNGALAAPTLANIDADADLEVVLNTAHSGLVAYDLPGTSRARILWGTGRGNYLRNGYLKNPPPPTGSLEKSYKSVKVTSDGVNAVLAYTIHLENSGVDLPTVRLTDTLPTGMQYQGNLWASSGTPNFNAGNITWHGAVSSDAPVTITFSANVTVQTIAIPTTFSNTVRINDGQGNVLKRSVSAVIYGRRIYLPLAIKRKS